MRGGIDILSKQVSLPTTINKNGIKSSKQRLLFRKDVVYHQLIETLLEGKGIKGIIDAIYLKTKQRILLISLAGKVIYYQGYEHYPSVVLTLAFLAIEQNKTSYPERAPEQINVQIDGNDVDCFVVPVLKKGRKTAFLLAVTESKYLNQQIAEYLQVTAQVIALELDRESLLLSMEQKYKTEFIIDLLLNKDQDKEKLDLVSRAWEWNLFEPHLVFMASYNPCNRIKKEYFTQILKSELEQFIGNKFLHLIYNNMHIILVQLKDVNKLDMVNLMRKAYRKINMDTPVGTKLIFACQSISRCDYNLGKGYKEAYYSLQLGLEAEEQGAFILFDDLGIYGILYNIYKNKETASQLGNFYEEKLGKLINYDQQNSTVLYKTLITYLENNCNTSLTAEKLFIHANSLRYRINKIEKLLKVDLAKLECTVEILLAIKINKLQKCLNTNLSDGYKY